MFFSHSFFFVFYFINCLYLLITSLFSFFIAFFIGCPYLFFLFRLSFFIGCLYLFFFFYRLFYRLSLSIFSFIDPLFYRLSLYFFLFLHFLVSPFYRGFSLLFFSHSFFFLGYRLFRVFFIPFLLIVFMY